MLQRAAAAWFGALLSFHSSSHCFLTPCPLSFSSKLCHSSSPASYSASSFPILNPRPLPKMVSVHWPENMVSYRDPSPLPDSPPPPLPVKKRCHRHRQVTCVCVLCLKAMYVFVFDTSFTESITFQTKSDCRLQQSRSLMFFFFFFFLTFLTLYDLGKRIQICF